MLTVPHAADGRCLSEFQALPGSACVRLPAAADLSHLLMAQQLGTVVYALRRYPLDLVGRDVAVIGQGSAGAFFTFLLKRAGAARVLVSDKSPARLAYGRQLGADLAVDAGSTDFRAAVLEETGGRGADLVVEAVGSRETFPLSLELAAAESTILWFGLPEGTADYPISFNDFFRRKLTAYSTYRRPGGARPGVVPVRRAADRRRRDRRIPAAQPHAADRRSRRGLPYRPDADRQRTEGLHQVLTGQPPGRR